MTFMEATWAITQNVNMLEGHLRHNSKRANNLEDTRTHRVEI